jgi:hypothetical protein
MENPRAASTLQEDRLRQLKMDPTPAEGTSEAAHIGTIHRFVRGELSEAQRSAGKKFSDVETAKFIDGLFARNVTFKGFFGGTSSQALLSVKPGDVRKALTADFAARGVTPTDADILGAYLRLKSRNTKAGGATGPY